jgi:hypothetical protein
MQSRMISLDKLLDSFDLQKYSHKLHLSMQLVSKSGGGSAHNAILNPVQDCC